jgi:glycosyltransferase involved in cell wall biosynthesis
MTSREGHIALNAHLLAGRASYRSAGIHHYIANLLPQLPAAGPDLRYTVLVGQGQPNLPGATIHRSRWPTTPPLGRIVWEQFAQPLVLERLRPDLLHALAFVSPLLSRCPAVVTVYDLSFRLMPERFLPAQRLYLSLFSAHSCRRARRVIAISHSTKADVVRLFNIAPDKVDVACPGVDAVFRPWPPAQVEAFRISQGLPEKFILYLGTLEPRKNLAALIRAFARLRAQSRANVSNPKLILAGAKGWLYEDLFRLVQELELTDSIFFPGYVPAEALTGWYNAAAVFAYPSSYEGFGMPVLEALACGRPVVTSNVSSLPEAGGDAALSVSPEDVDALTEALARALALAPEERQRGPAHAARFTWANTAAQTVASYRQALTPQRLAQQPAGG